MRAAGKDEYRPGPNMFALPLSFAGMQLTDFVTNRQHHGSECSSRAREVCEVL